MNSLYCLFVPLVGSFQTSTRECCSWANHSPEDKEVADGVPGPCLQDLDPFLLFGYKKDFEIKIPNWLLSNKESFKICCL